MSIAIIIVIVILAVVFFVIKSKTKSLVLPNVFLITGGVKSGKSLLSVSLAIKQIRKNVFMWYISLPFHHLKKWFMKTFKKVDYVIPLKPMLYSNIPLDYYHNRLTMNIILRKVKLPLNSVVLLDEASLLADSLMYKSNYLNDELRLFCKLFCHANGNNSYLIVNTQAFSDLHLAFKRSMGTYLYIYERTKFPFVTIFKVREMISVDDNASNISDKDFEESCKTMWCFNLMYKKYSSRCYSSLTDDLQYEVDYKKAKYKTDLYTDNILDLHDLYNELLLKEKNKK